MKRYSAQRELIICLLCAVGILWLLVYAVGSLFS